MPKDIKKDKDKFKKEDEIEENEDEDIVEIDLKSMDDEVEPEVHHVAEELDEEVLEALNVKKKKHQPQSDVDYIAEMERGDIGDDL